MLIRIFLIIIAIYFAIKIVNKITSSKKKREVRFTREGKRVVIDADYEVEDTPNSNEENK